MATHSSSSSSSRGPKLDWSIINRLKSTSSSAADALMDEIDSAIAAAEYVQASHHLRNVCAYDAEAADEAYRAGCAAVARGDFESGMELLEVALAKCPPNKTNAISKVQTLIAHTKQQLAAAAVIHS